MTTWRIRRMIKVEIFLQFNLGYKTLKDVGRSCKELE